LVNFVAVQERAEWTAEAWSAPGDPDELRRAFAGWHPDVIRFLGAVDTTFLWGLFTRPEQVRWTEGALALIGDAAHPMMPFYAQGAAQSIEDAYVLAGCLAASPAEPEAALERYVRLRQPRTAWMQGLSRREEELYQMTDQTEIAARNARMRSNRTPERATFPPEQIRLYGYDAEAALQAA
jgi:salicylate hydroxylase